ncbi:MAG: sigma-54-dependent Fis family transcriptional regulator [Deltaproteobacteria bacterium]|nr:sigma-54-dependent Fis family transcriptional regulator [Deltaproteobacteria bacterium]
MIRSADSVPLAIGGVAVAHETRLSAGDLQRGIALEVAQRVLLLVHRRPARRPSPPELRLVGESVELDEIRRQILQVADLGVPTLILGETGTGKELVAEAIHNASRRSSLPFVSVNMAAIAPTVAASELFGHRRGAFTGAVGDRVGFFQQAHGGTIFLDEVGEMPVDVQVMLLRTLESATIQPVGAPSTQPIDARVLSATDSDLSKLVAEQRFRPALLHRLSGFEISLPPLRNRRDDLGRLLSHFLQKELAGTGDWDLVESRMKDARPWISLDVVRSFFDYEWPGNVRQLRNLVRQLAIANRGADTATLPAAIQRTLSEGLLEASPSRPAARTERRKPSDVEGEELISALKAHRFNIHATAEFLGITRPSLYMLIEKSDHLRKASDISAVEIRLAHAEANGNLNLMAERLEVSPRGLRLRLGSLGLTES